MAKGRDRHDARRAAVAALGKDLARRASSRCELCAEGGPLSIVEIAPVPDEPGLEQAALLCGRCEAGVGGDDGPDPEALRFLQGAVWAEPRPVRLAAVRWTQRLGNAGVQWAVDTLDGLYTEP